MGGLYFVAGDYDIGDLEGGGQDEPWQLVHAVVGFSSVQVQIVHEHEDGDTCSGTVMQGHPMLLEPTENRDALGGGPATVYMGGDGLFFTSWDEAHAEAEKTLARLLVEQVEIEELERMVHGPGEDEEWTGED